MNVDLGIWSKLTKMVTWLLLVAGLLLVGDENVGVEHQRPPGFFRHEHRNWSGIGLGAGAGGIVVEDFVDEALGLHAGHARHALHAGVVISLREAGEGACKRNAQKRCQSCCDALHGTGILSSGVRLGKRLV